jgi:hypothetical protein
MWTLAAPWREVTGILQRAILQLDGLHVLASVFHRLLDRDRHFTRLATTKADAAFAITHHRQRRKAELAATLDHFGNTVDANQLFVQAITSRLCFYTRHNSTLTLEVQTVFTRGIRQRLDTTVIPESGAVKCDLGHSGSLGALCDGLANRYSRVRCCQSLIRLARSSLSMVEALASTDRRATGIDQLRIDMARSTMNAQAHNREFVQSLHGCDGRDADVKPFLVHYDTPYFFLASLRRTFSSA